MILDFILGALAIAGFAVVWRNWLEDHESWKQWLQKHVGTFNKAVTCGSCFTYWLALVYTIGVRPLENWAPLGDYAAAFPVHLFLEWMALAWISVFLRFAYVAIQELVSYQVHTLKGHTHH